MMVEEHHKGRFGVVAIAKEFITVDQFSEAIKIQTNEDLSSSGHRLIGEILVDLGYMNTSQINEVLEELVESAYRFECPQCGIMIYNCPNCKAQLR